MIPSVFECSLALFIIFSMCHSITEAPGIQRFITSKNLNLMWEAKEWNWCSGLRGTLEVDTEDHKVTEAGVMPVLLSSRSFQSQTRLKVFLSKLNSLKAIEDILSLIFFFAIVNNTSMNNFTHSLHSIFCLRLIPRTKTAKPNGECSEDFHKILSYFPLRWCNNFKLAR